ncbi:MAG: hypothetical protein L0Z48_08885 [candidate division Zixibacteria bacterium]|nr:hypothetical protein [candidate division Zixibacteria bacterium]MCI0596635.1 hypothetical protein [candidate division Zixibacteria bacterium]
MRRTFILTVFAVFFPFTANVFATHQVDSIRVTVSSGSHTISTTSFPNGVWFILSGGVRETVKTIPPFPTVTPGMMVTVTYDLASNPDSVVGANFDMSMDGVGHPGGNLKTGSAWLACLNQFCDLAGHPPNDADTKYELVLKPDSPNVPALTPVGLAILIVLLAGTAYFYFLRRRRLAA